MSEKNHSLHFQKTKSMLFFVICFLSLASFSFYSHAQNNQVYDGPGTDYHYPEQHMIFLNYEHRDVVPLYLMSSLM